MKKLFFIYPEFRDTITGGSLYDNEVSKHLKKICVSAKKIIVSNTIDRVKLSYLVNNLPKKSIILIDGYLANKIYFLFHNNIHTLVHHPCCLESKQGKMSNLNLYFNEKRALSYSKSIITVSYNMKKVINSILYRAVKMEVAYPGIDRRYYVNKRHMDAKNILAIGSVIERKGYNILIEALAKVRKNWHLNIIGKYSNKDPYYLNLIDQITKYKINDKVTFLGNISNNNKMKYMINSKIFVLPTFYEGFGISLVEASALGLNIITSDLPVLREVLKGGNVCFIPVNDVEKLSNAVENCLLGESVVNDSCLKYYNWANTARTMKRALYAS